MSVSIAIVGDLTVDNPFRIATDQAIWHAAMAVGVVVKSHWIGTDELGGSSVEQKLKQIHALWIAPGSPYKNMNAALAAIRFARENKVPLLGTCGGFQHIILEYARNVLGVIDAEHAETNPYTSVLFISRLACSLVGRTMTITLQPGSLVARAYGKPVAQEGYYCNFGVNPDYIASLRRGLLRVVASDKEGEVRAVELPGHPFFVGTLFIPQLASTADHPHPLIVALVQAAAAAKRPANSVEKIETKRLLGRRIQPDDFELLRQLQQNSQVAATLGGARSDEEVRQMLVAYLEHWNRVGFGLWMWFSKTDEQFTGRGGVRPIVIDGRDEIEVAYALMPEFWNQGLATEIAQASVNVAFNELDLTELACFTLPTNLASRRVMEKVGFIFERDFIWKDLPHVLYRLRR